MIVDSLPCVNFSPYIKEHLKDIFICWYHPNFSQCRYPPGQKDSKACTLICVLLAQLICKTNHVINNVEEDSTLNFIIAKAIITGNKIHSELLNKKLISHPYMSAEEALNFGGDSNILKEWDFQIFDENMKINLYTNIKSFIDKWTSNPLSSNLFMLLIACNRTVLFIFQEQNQKIILFDPHKHNILDFKLPIQRGLVLAEINFTQLKLLCDWYVDIVLYNFCRHKAYQYELTFLYNCKKLKNAPRSCTCNCKNKIKN